MSTATLERVALPEGFTESVFEQRSRERSGWDRLYRATLTRGATEWRVDFMFSAGPLHERLVLDGQPFHRPVVHIHKGQGYRSKQVFGDDAPLYVQKFVDQHIMAVAAFEQQRHGVPPMTMAECLKWQAAEEAARRREEAIKATQQRQLVQMVARDVRNAAQCGTANSEAIAAWILERFVDRYEHEGAIEDLKAEHTEALAEARDGHGELIDELNTAIDHAKAAAEVLDVVGGTMQRLDEHNPLAFAYGATDLDKIKDVLQPATDAMDLFDRADWNYGPLPEKREVK